MPDPVWYEGGWGGIRLWMSKISTDEGRTLVVTNYTTGDTPDVQNRGNVPAIARVTILFDDFEGETLDALTRLQNLIDLKDAGLPSVFTHPMKGSYLAEIGEFTSDVDENGVVTATASFVPTEEVHAVVQPGSGASLAAGGVQVEAAAADLDRVLAESFIAAFTRPTTPAISADSLAAVKGWRDRVDAAGRAVSSARQVFVDVASLSDRISGAIDDLELEKNVALWPVMKSYVMLGEALRAAGASATGDLGQLMSIRVSSPISLRAILAGIYPADQSETQYGKAIDLNDIKTPARIPPGTTLQLEQPRR